MGRKRLFFVILMILLTLCLGIGSLAGCSIKEGALPEKVTEITLWFWWDQEHEKRELRKLVEEFHHTQDEIQVKIRYIPAEDFKKRMALSMADDSMPDLAVLDSVDFQFLHAMQPFAELTEELEEWDAYIPQMMQSCAEDGKIYALPLGFSCSVLYYNEDIFRQHTLEIPQTWDTLYETALKLSDEEHGGFALPVLRKEESVFNFLPILWSGGGDIDHLDSEESRRAFSFLRRLAESGAMSRQVVNLTAGDLAIQFAEGNIAMMMNSSAMVNSIREYNPELHFKVAVPPAIDEKEGYVSAAGGAALLGVTKGEHQEEAIAFLRFVSEKDRILKHMDGFGFMAARQDVLAQQVLDDIQKQKVLEIAKTSQNRELSVKWPYISEVFAEVVEQEIIGEQEEAEILKEAAKKMREIRGEDL